MRFVSSENLAYFAFLVAANQRVMGSKADLFATPGVVPEGERAEVEAATKGFVFQQTM